MHDGFSRHTMVFDAGNDCYSVEYLLTRQGIACKVDTLPALATVRVPTTSQAERDSIEAMISNRFPRVRRSS